MIIEELYSDTLIRHYSDRGMMIRQVETGTEYAEAIDILPCKYTYDETENPIPDYGEEATAEDYEAALNKLGVDV